MVEKGNKTENSSDFVLSFLKRADQVTFRIQNWFQNLQQFPVYFVVAEIIPI